MIRPPVIRLVISDVDGTIVRHDKSVAPSTVDAAAKLRAAGIDLSIVSARPTRGMRYIQETLALTGPLAGYNGGRIEAPDGTVLEERFVPEAIARAALGLFAARGLQTWIFSGEQWLVPSLEAPHVAHETRAVRFAPTLLEDVEQWLPRVSKMVGVSDDEPFLARVEQELQTLVATDAQAKRSQTYYLDLTAQEANKGEAVRRLASARGVALEEVAVLGDMINDLPMFEVAGFAVAMGNASEPVKARADAVTADNDSDGWAHAIESFILPRARLPLDRA